ncbi:MAG: MarR family transcriptional regulator [Anaerolineae bacterium]|nr:MarR family transcriptional regulator [Anaerolineae bacterium]
MDTKQQFVEDVGMFFERLGLTRMAGRIIGWLMVCDPPQQTMGDIVDALGASKSTISTALRELQTFHTVTRFSLPGERRDYYRLDNAVWERSLEARLLETAAFSQFAQRGLALLTDHEAVQRERLQEMLDFFAFLEREVPAMLQRWDELKAARAKTTSG